MTIELKRSAQAVAESFKSADLVFGGKKLSILGLGPEPQLSCSTPY